MNAAGVNMKLSTTLVFLVASVQLACSQGYVMFANTSAAKVSTNAAFGGASTGLTSGAVPSYYFGLFVAPTNQTTADPSLAGWSFTGYYATNTPSPGRFNGNTTSDGVAISGYGIGSRANFLIAGWSAAIGHDWDQVQAWRAQPAQDNWFGLSGVAQNILVGGGPVPPDSLFGSSASQIGPFTLNLRLSGPQILSLSKTGSVAILTWSAVLNSIYRIQYSTNLTTPNWTDLFPDVKATAATASFTDYPSTDATRCYRVLRF
jgi:hypothetical protein